MRINKISVTLVFLSVLLLGCNNTNKKSNNESRIEEKEKLEIEGNINLIGCDIYGTDEKGYSGYNIKLKNNTNQIIKTITISTQFLDNQDVILSSQGPQASYRVMPNQEFVVRGVFESEEVAKISFDEFSFYDNDDNFVTNSFSEKNNNIDATKLGETQFSKETNYNNVLIEKSMKFDELTDQIKLDEIKVENSDEKEYAYLNVKVTNNTNNNIKNLTLNFVFIDTNGNISDSTATQESTSIKPNQSLKMKGTFKIENNKYVYLDSYSYYIGDDYYQKYVSNIDRATSLPNE